jgi:hypothetical protein
MAMPWRFADGYATTAGVFTFDGLTDGREHLEFGRGDRAGACTQDAPGGPVPLVRPRSGCLTRYTVDFRTTRRPRPPVLIVNGVRTEQP